VTDTTAPDDKQLKKYNYEHFWLKHFLADIGRTFKGAGVRPGEKAPEFEMPSTDGEQVSLRALHGEPVLLHFGSGT
jgi:cytochrome oxidase Cu insertion factor (SCO1/SenC/PrrC family)